jgi:hypothetical protein
MCEDSGILWHCDNYTEKAKTAKRTLLAHEFFLLSVATSGNNHIAAFNCMLQYVNLTKMAPSSYTAVSPCEVM